MKVIKRNLFVWYGMRYKFELMIIFFLCFLIALTCSCRTSKFVIKTDYKIDTIFVNHDINTVSVVTDTLLKTDTIKVENQFSKVKVYYDNIGKIKVDLTSLPFEIKYQLAVSKKEVIRKVEKTKLSTILLYCLFSFLIGAISSGFVLYKIFRQYKLSKI